jgi:hypothetical protein
MDNNDIPMLAKLADNVCLSGGASGADVTWGNAAASVGHQVVHWSFKGHKSHDPDNTYILTDDELHEADDFLKEANLTLKRRLNFKKRFIKLLQRNWFQVKYADSVYAVGTLNENAVIYDPRVGNDATYHLTHDRVDRLGVNGGTAWACQLYLDKYRRELGQNEFCLIFYDQLRREMYTYSPIRGCWMPYTHTSLMGKPSGVYAAIGSRDLYTNGVAFIKEVFNR